MRIDSISEQSKIAQKANAVIVPPDHIPMDDVDIIYFNNVIAEFAKAEWSAHQIELAAMLARAMNDMEKESRLLREEGSISYSERGTPVCNPRKTIVQMAASTILAMRRSLSLHARAQKGNPGDVAKRQAIAKAVESDVAGLDDSLIATMQ
jgi:hypothetical protein